MGPLPRGLDGNFSILWPRFTFWLRHECLCLYFVLVTHMVQNLTGRAVERKSYCELKIMQKNGSWSENDVPPPVIRLFIIGISIISSLHPKIPRAYSQFPVSSTFRPAHRKLTKNKRTMKTRLIMFGIQALWKYKLTTRNKNNSPSFNIMLS